MLNKQHLQNEVYFIRQKELKQAKNGSNYLKLELCQEGYRIFGHYWKSAKSYYDKLHFATVVIISGQYEEINGHKYLRINSLKIAANQKAIESGVIEENKLTWFRSEIKKLKEDHRKLIEKAFVLERLIKLFIFPAGKLWAFRQEGGLHLKIQEIFKHLELFHPKKLNISLIKTAVFLQAVGFIEGMYNEGLYEYKTNAKLLSIPLVALDQLEYLIRKELKDDRERLHLKHLVLIMPIYSDKGKDFQAKSLEAITFYNLQVLISDYAAVESVKRKEENVKRKWSIYNKQLERFIYLENHL